MEIQIRTACKEDAAAICRLCSEEMGYSCDVALVESKLNQLDSSREAVFFAELDGSAPAGYLHVEKYDVLYFETMANILGLAVSAQYQRNGVGSALIQAAETWAREHGIHLMRLNSGGSRKGAHAFYRKQGYTDVKEQLRFNKRLDK